MKKSISDLVIRLRNQIRDNGAVQAFPDATDANGVPIPGSSPELQQFIEDALSIYSKWRPRRRPTTISLQPGQTTYPLPVDWITADIGSFQRALQPPPLPDPDIYALPFVYAIQPLGVQTSTINFSWYDDDQTMSVDSNPLSAYTLNFDYFALHAADATTCTIPDQMIYYALLPAAENALRAIATDYAVKLQKYKVGGRAGMEIDDSKISENLLSEAEKYRALFEKEIIFKPYGTSGGDDVWR